MHISDRMNTRISVHDNTILSYEVNVIGRVIRFKTLSITDPTERTDVVFEGVECYRFEFDWNGQSIIHSFQRVPALEIFDSLESELPRTLPYAWPGLWAKSRENAQAYFESENISGWYLTPCLGLTGWVLAQSMEFVAVEQ